MHFVLNWKTSTAGVAMILGAVGDILTQASTGNWDTGRLIADWTALSGGVGFLFAKDMNVTGGTVAATSEAAKRI